MITQTIAVIILNFEQHGFTVQQCVHKANSVNSESPLFAQTCLPDYLNIIIFNFSFAGMMSVLSQRVSLSQKYTNHSLRATSVQIQIPTRHNMGVTGHKAETSLKTYTGHTNKKQNNETHV